MWCGLAVEVPSICFVFALPQRHAAVPFFLYVMKDDTNDSICHRCRAKRHVAGASMAATGHSDWSIHSGDHWGRDFGENFSGEGG